MYVFAQVIVCDCLAHELNVDYVGFVGERLEKINDTTVLNLMHAVCDSDVVCVFYMIL